MHAVFPLYVRVRLRAVLNGRAVWLDAAVYLYSAFHLLSVAPYQITP